MQRAAGATERLMELLYAQPQIKPVVDPIFIPPPVKGRVRLEKVFSLSLTPTILGLRGLYTRGLSR
ncbi:MAG: hypothetical protein ACREYE_06260 [Gammaproteobacteria bacterium]